jgi:hypothetical protein
MTPEQDKAMMAVLKAIAKARRTGLTEQQITDRIERTKPDEAIDAGRRVLAGLNLADKSNPDESNPRTDLIIGRVQSGEGRTDESTPLSGLDVLAGKEKKKNKKSR